MPQQDDLEEWLEALRERAEAHADRPLHPALAEFRQLIDSDPVVRLYVHQMIEQEPGGSRAYSQRHIDGVPQLLALMNEVLHSAPEFDEQAMVMTPLNAVLDWTMGTPAGFAAYRDRRINDALRKNLLPRLRSWRPRRVRADGDSAAWGKYGAGALAPRHSQTRLISGARHARYAPTVDVSCGAGVRGGR